MFEKVNPAHPDKVADRIAGAIVDLAYRIQENPKIAVEVMIGHDMCDIMVESSIDGETWAYAQHDVFKAVNRINGSETETVLVTNSQDEKLAKNQSEELRCGDNGIFVGFPLNAEEKRLTRYAHRLWDAFPSDGKFILDQYTRLIICQSNATELQVLTTLPNMAGMRESVTVNPLGDWTGGTGVDVGCTNRKLGSDMGRACTGGGLHGKDLSKADVSVNIFAYLQAQERGTVRLGCAIGDTTVDGEIGGEAVCIPYKDIVQTARNYIDELGGFEKFAEWGLIR